VALFAAVTWIALESGGVAIVETRKPDGSVRSTHVWFVERGGDLWLEAGAPENPWFLDAQRDPRLGFRAEHTSGQFVAEPADDPTRHREIRALLRAKYGWRDRWVGMLVDSTQSRAVRLIRETDR